MYMVHACCVQACMQHVCTQHACTMHVHSMHVHSMHALWMYTACMQHACTQHACTMHVHSTAPPCSLARSLSLSLSLSLALALSLSLSLALSRSRPLCTYVCVCMRVHSARSPTRTQGNVRGHGAGCQLDRPEKRWAMNARDFSTICAPKCVAAQDSSPPCPCPCVGRRGVVEKALALRESVRKKGQRAHACVRARERETEGDRRRQTDRGKT